MTYVLRSVLPSGCEAKVGHCGAIGTGEFSKLGGYGVELALKNMEYKAMDDSAVRKGLFTPRELFSCIIWSEICQASSTSCLYIVRLLYICLILKFTCLPYIRCILP